jgi:hypothetical protein
MVPDAGGPRDGGVPDSGVECDDDLDCPAPELCVEGRCQIPF